MSTLYLTHTERALYDKLPSSLKNSWGGEVVEETGTAWETEKQLFRRANLLSSEMSPALKLQIERVAQKINIQGYSALSDREIPQNIIPQLFLTLGAVGIRHMIANAWSTLQSVGDLDDLQQLSEIRHRILLTNHFLIT